MLGAGGRYFAHLDFTGAPPSSVKITNSGDKPATVKTTGSAITPDACRTISIESKLGGVRLAIPVNVTS